MTLDQRSSTDWDVNDSNTTVWRADARVPAEDMDFTVPPTVATGEDPPEGPQPGDLWLSSDGTLYVWADDGGGLAWLPVSAWPPPVTSVFGRQGEVTSSDGDYESAQIAIDPVISAGRPYGNVRLYLQSLSVDVDAAVQEAQDAASDASQASTDAAEALATANAVDAKATTALNTANTANATANAAVTAAATADTKATSAQTTANAAQTAAATADSKAVAAQTTANTANTTANTANSTANAAMPKAGGTFTGAVTFGTTDAATLPSGTTAQRPAGTAGQIRYNSQTASFEGYTTAWGALSGGGSAVSVGVSPPASPQVGNLWWNSEDGNLYIWYDDSTSQQWVPASAVPQGRLPVAVGVWYPGLLPSSATLMQFVSPDPWTIPAACAGSQGSAGTAATGSVTINIQKNGVTQGSVNFAVSATTATFTLASALSFVVGDRLTLVAPASADATLANVSVTLKGTR